MSASSAPVLLVIGDSISVGFMPFLERRLTGWRVVHNPGNAEHSRRVRESLDDWLAAEPDADVVHVNCGLHDIKLDRETGRLQVPLDEYRRNLRAVAERLAAGPFKAIWASTTPVLYRRHRRVKPFDRRQGDVDAFNAAARRIMRRAGVPIDDLHGVIADAGKEACLREDGVHMTDGASDRLAAAVAACARSVLR